jgi:hypothetical protein
MVGVGNGKGQKQGKRKRQSEDLSHCRGRLQSEFDTVVATRPDVQLR